MLNISECEFLLNSPLLDVKIATLKIRNAKGEIRKIDIHKK